MVSMSGFSICRELRSGIYIYIYIYACVRLQDFNAYCAQMFWMLMEMLLCCCVVLFF